MLYDRKKYELYYDGTTIEVLEPLEWNDDEKSYERNLTYHGIAVNLATALTFVKEGANFLVSCLDLGGVNADVRLRKYTRNEQTDIWELDYEGWIDFLTYKITEDGFNVSLNAEPLTVLLKSKLNTKVELSRLDTLTEQSIDPLLTEDLFIEGREVLLTNKLATADNAYMSIFSSSSREYIGGMLIDELGNNSAGIVDVKSQVTRDVRLWDNKGSSSEAFLSWNDTGSDKVYRVNIRLKQSFFWYGGSASVDFRIRLVRYSGAAVQNYVDAIDIFSYQGILNDMDREIDVVYPEIILDVPIGYSASIHYYLKAGGDGCRILHAYPLSCSSYDGNTTGNCLFEDKNGMMKPAYIEHSVTVQEDSIRKVSNTKCIKINNFAKRLVDIILECDYKSNLLSNSDVSDIVLTHGMWLRGMINGENNFKPLSTTLKDFLESLDAYTPIGIDISNNLFTLEKRDYFYQQFVSIYLGEVSELELSPSEEDYYSTIKAGYVNNIGYDEDLGLDEYNRLTEYNTILNKTDKTLDLAPKYRSDPYGLETVRRENPEVGDGDKGSDDDTKFDDDIWMIDANEVASQTSLVVSSWSKRFATKPSGVYSADTAFNLWFSPINMILRHGIWIKAGLLKYLDSSIKFNSSEGNSSLTTQLIGGKAYTQDIGVPVEDFNRSVHQGKIATFRAKVSWNQLNGKANGIPNRYGQVEFTKNGVKYRGFIMSVKTQYGVGDFKVKIATSISAALAPKGPVIINKPNKPTILNII